MNQQETDQSSKDIAKPINWVVPESIKTEHATHLIVQQQNSEFILYFFEIQSPIFSGTPEEQLAAYKALPATEARCIAKFVMSAENASLATSNMVDSINKFYEVLQSMQSMKEKNHGTSSELSARS